MYVPSNLCAHVTWVWFLASLLRSRRLTEPPRPCERGGPRLRTRKAFASAEARRWTEPVWQLSDRPRHPFGPHLQTCIKYQIETLAGRGGSVSRRDHNQVYRETRPTSQAEPTKKKSRTPNASRSSGEGVWGGGASLREAASSPESPSKNKNPLPSMQNGSGTMAAYRRDGDYFRDAPSASQAASASASGSSWQVTLSQANTMPAARQLSSQVRIHSPSPQP